MLVEASNGGIPKEDAAAAIRLQAMLVRVDDNAVDLAKPVVGVSRRTVEVVGQSEIAAVGGIRMDAKPVMAGQREQLGQRIDRARTGGPDRCDERADAALARQGLDRVRFDTAITIRRQSREALSKHASQARMRVVRLFRGHHQFVRVQRSRHPQRLQVCHGATAGQMAEMDVPAEQPGDGGDGLFFHRRARAAAVQRMIVGVDPHREQVRQPRDRVRRLQHLAGIQWMRIGVVVAETRRDRAQHVDQVRFPPTAAGGRQARKLRIHDIQQVAQRIEARAVEQSTCAVNHAVRSDRRMNLPSTGSGNRRTLACAVQPPLR